MMRSYTVTQRARTVKQPRNGYINPEKMESIQLGEGIEALNPEENISPALVGTAVDNMTRYLLGGSVKDAFEISLFGARGIREETKAQELLNGIKGLDADSIINAVKLTGYDCIYRASTSQYVPVDELMPDAATIENIITMLIRSQYFFEKYGPMVMHGFTFEEGYSNTVSEGDGDFLTKDTLWDFKVSKRPIKREHTLQLLIYWRLGLHSIHPEFMDIQYLGIFNPRMNIVSRIAVSDIPTDIIREVEKEVIGYGEEELDISEVFYLRQSLFK